MSLMGAQAESHAAGSVRGTAGSMVTPTAAAGTAKVVM